jgi:hypothetical protein
VTSTGLAQVPMPVAPGEEMDIFVRFRPDVTWTGTIMENGVGPGSPPMTAIGRGTHRLIQDGRWIMGDYEQDQFAPDGGFVLTRQTHWVAGWDPMKREYRVTIADNYAGADVMRGRIQGERIVFETIGDAPTHLRSVLDVSDPTDISWTNEVAVGFGLWSLIDTYHITPEGR